MERPQYDIVASGARMRAIRKARRLTVAQVVEYMGFESQQSIYKWESGKCYPQADNLIALARLYQVSPFELIVEAGSEEPASFILQIFMNLTTGSFHF